MYALVAPLEWMEEQLTELLEKEYISWENDIERIFSGWGKTKTYEELRRIITNWERGILTDYELQQQWKDALSDYREHIRKRIRDI